MNIILNYRYLMFFVLFLFACSKGETQNNIKKEIIPVTGSEEDYNTIYDYDVIDFYAINTPEDVEYNVGALANHLESGAETDRDKARVIYRWITKHIAYNSDDWEIGQLYDTDLNSVLKNRRCVCAGYATLYKSLADSMGLGCEIITGLAKGERYQVGMPLNESTISNLAHAWNAVKIDGKWYLLDATWGAGYVMNDLYVRQIDDFYFLTPPEKFVVRHLPSDEKWQLLKEPKTIEWFASIPLIRSPYFENNVRAISNDHGVLATSGGFTVEFETPSNVSILAELMGVYDITGNYVLTNRENEKSTINVTPPSKGDYILRIYSRNDYDTEEFNWTMDYRIKSTEGSEFGLPETFAPFNMSRCYLYSPISGALEYGKTYQFKIRVENAEKVAVVHNKEWTMLSEDANDPNIFIGSVRIDTDSETFIMKSTNIENEYEGLVRYDID